MKGACGHIILEPTKETQEKNMNKILQPTVYEYNINDFIHDIVDTLLASSEK